MTNLYVASHRLHETLDRDEVLRALEEILINLVGCDEPSPTACVPLRVGERVVGLITLFRLLPHKLELQRLDRALLELLAQAGGAALHHTAPPEGAP